MRQVVALLGYGEPQCLKVFQNTLPSTVYWILFPIGDLQKVLETTSRRAGQKASTPFMSLEDGTGSSKINVIFDLHIVLNVIRDTLTAMMSKFRTQNAM